jgi:hypothetical protein
MLAPYFRCSLIGDCFKFPCKFPGKLVPDYPQTSKRTGRLLCLLQLSNHIVLSHRNTSECLRVNVSTLKSVRVDECQSVCVYECESGVVYTLMSV